MCASYEGSNVSLERQRQQASMHLPASQENSSGAADVNDIYKCLKEFNAGMEERSNQLFNKEK